MAFDIKDYVEVKDRVAAFNVKYPDGSIQTEVTTLTDKLVVVKATVYRTPAEMRPTTGHSQMCIPGVTSFTKGSEVENTETSAVGRALAFLGFEVKKSLASREEVENKQAPRDRRSTPKPAQENPDAPARASQKPWMKTANIEVREANTTIRTVLGLPESANIIQELEKFQGKQTDDEALAAFRLKMKESLESGDS